MLTSHPYWGQSFGSFFLTFFSRMGEWIKGELTWSELAPDEIQMGVLILIALSSALLGTFLVLTKMTMLANALSHTILLGLALSFILGRVDGQAPVLSLSTLLLAALISACVTMGTFELLHRGARLQRDASIGLVFTTFFALGVVLVSTTARYSHLGVEAIMGNVDALHYTDMRLAAVILGGNILLLALFFKRWKIAAFDPVLARSFGLPLMLLQAALLFQSATTAVISFRAVGVFLFLALLVVPVTIARLIVKRLKMVIVLAALIGSVTSVLAVALSRHLLSIHYIALSTAGLEALLLALLLSLSSFVCACRRYFEKRRYKKKVCPT